MCSAVRRNDGMEQVNLQIPLFFSISSAHIPYHPSYISSVQLFMIDHLWRTSNPRSPRFTKPLPDLLCNMLLSRSTTIRPVTVCSNVAGSESDQAPNLSYHIFRLSAHQHVMMLCLETEVKINLGLLQVKRDGVGAAVVFRESYDTDCR